MVTLIANQQIAALYTGKVVTETMLSTIEERLSKQAARREKQRQDNVGRAAKMHAARIEAEKSVAASTEADESQDGQVYIGCSGWFYWHWRGVFYPAELPTSGWFKHYAGRFKTVELNAPFYSWPTIATVNSWTRQAGRRDFVYTVKVCELITHVKLLRHQATSARLRPDCRSARAAHGMPPISASAQFPLHTGASEKDPGPLDHRRRNVVEFRHKSWWNEAVYSAFRETGTIFCSCSGPRLPDELIKTADDIYIRFHGTKQWYRHDYTKEELGIWAKRIENSGAKTVWAYFNNDRNAYAIKNARALSRLLQTWAQAV